VRASVVPQFEILIAFGGAKLWQQSEVKRTRDERR
jgi:hypothetical protein